MPPATGPADPENTPTRHTPAFSLAVAASFATGTPEQYTIFEGTSEIQRLVIARAISGLQIR